MNTKGKIHERIQMYVHNGESFEKFTAQLNKALDEAVRLKMESVQLEWDIHEEYGDHYVAFYVAGWRPENDDDRQRKLDEEAKSKAFRRHQYDKLKEEFGDKG